MILWLTFKLGTYSDDFTFNSDKIKKFGTQILTAVTLKDLVFWNIILQ
jgi:hypothetical protein